MSQITERKNAIGIQGISLRECQNDIASLISTAAVSTVKTMMPELLKACAPGVITAVKPHILRSLQNRPSVMLSSPAVIQEAFAMPFKSRVRQFTDLGLDAAEAKQAAVICALSELDFVVLNPIIVKEQLQRAFSQKTEREVDQAFKAGFNELNSGQTQIFTSTLGSACAKASVESGFPNVVIKRLPLKQGVLITALNDKGQGLISEITVDKTYQVNTTTEVTGIHDGSCIAVMNRFNDALKRLGVKHSNEKTESTLLQACDGKDLTNSIARTRRLNQQSKQKN